MGERRSPPSLEQLEARLREAREEAASPAERPVTSQRQMGIAYRVLVEMIAGIGVGAFLGWVVDRWLGTEPLFLVVLVLLGFAAGILNAYRAIQQLPGGRADQASRQGPDNGSRKT